MFQNDQTEQSQLFAFSHRDLVSEDSDVWLYIDLFDNLNLKTFNEAYSYQGQVAKEPKLMLRVVFYGLTHGIVSGRKLEEACRNDNRFIVLSGNLRPDRRTIDRFLERHQDRMNRFFVDIVRLASAMGLLSLGRIAIDGSRFKANTSRYRSMSYEKIQRAIGHIEENLKKLREDLSKDNTEQSTELENSLPKEIRTQQSRLEKIKRAKQQIEKEYEQRSRYKKQADSGPSSKATKSLNDSDALSLSSRNKTYIFGYNAQAVVDEKTQIIVAADIHSKATDCEALPELLEQTKHSCGALPKQILADLGYKSVENLKSIEQAHCTPFIAMGTQDKQTIEVQFSEQITYKGKPHEYQCMAGKPLLVEARRKDGRTEFKLPERFCTDCKFAATCKAFGKKTMSVMSEQDRQTMNQNLGRSRTEEFKEIYKYRKAIVEPVFANIKNKGMRILVIGKSKVSLWWKLACTAHNIEKIIKSGRPVPQIAFA